jgi:hypothetical protein
MTSSTSSNTSLTAVSSLLVLFCCFIAACGGGLWLLTAWVNKTRDDVPVLQDAQAQKETLGAVPINLDWDPDAKDPTIVGLVRFTNKGDKPITLTVQFANGATASVQLNIDEEKTLDMSDRRVMFGMPISVSAVGYSPVRFDNGAAELKTKKRSPATHADEPPVRFNLETTPSKK